MLEPKPVSASLREQLDNHIIAWRKRGSNLISWYANPPAASDVLAFLDTLEQYLWLEHDRNSNSNHT